MRLPNGFAAVLEVSAADSAKLARRLVWLKTRQRHVTKDQRTYERFPMPPRAVALLSGEGARIDATLTDVSSSGVGVHSTARLPVGTAVEVNGIAGRVARWFDGGMGIQFDASYSLHELKRKLFARVKS